jgi:hypothetical protein
MRHLSIRRGAALLALLVLLAAPVAYADDPPLSDPPGAKIGPPIGAPSASPSVWELFILSVELFAKIGPPIG